MHITDAVRQKYPETLLGVLRVNDLKTTPDPAAWNELRTRETASFRASRITYERKSAVTASPLACYTGFYRQFKKTYPVLLQMESVLLKGREIRADCLAVETMFLAEVKHGLLVAGHDTQNLSGRFTLDLARGGEAFTMVAGQPRSLKTGDMFMADNGVILSSILEGQDYNTRLTEHSAGALYCVYALGGVSGAQVTAFFRDLRRYLLTAYPEASVQEEQVYLGCCG